jgi:hypothetical protein
MPLHISRCGEKDHAARGCGLIWQLPSPGLDLLPSDDREPNLTALLACLVNGPVAVHSYPSDGFRPLLAAAARRCARPAAERRPVPAPPGRRHGVAAAGKRGLITVGSPERRVTP